MYRSVVSGDGCSGRWIMHMHASGQCGCGSEREARLCRQKKVAAMAYYTQKLIRQAAAAISTRIDQTHALPDDQCKLLAAALMHICDMHAHLFPWPARQAGRGRHTMHLNLMTKLHACHAQMKLDPDLQTLRETDLHMDLHSARAPSPCMHSQRKETTTPGKRRRPARPPVPAGKKKAQKPHACMASPGHGWSVLFNHTKRRQLRPPSSRPSAVQTDQTGARVYMYLATSYFAPIRIIITCC